jgi:hypothetical protein
VLERDDFSPEAAREGEVCLQRTTSGESSLA